MLHYCRKILTTNKKEKKSIKSRSQQKHKNSILNSFPNHPFSGSAPSYYYLFAELKMYVKTFKWKSNWGNFIYCTNKFFLSLWNSSEHAPNWWYKILNILFFDIFKVSATAYNFWLQPRKTILCFLYQLPNLGA